MSRHRSDLREVEQSPDGRYLRFDEKLGNGAYKEVYLSYDTETGKEVAWNAVDMRRLPPNEKKRIRMETEILAELEHPHIINFYNVWENKQAEQICFTTEIVTSGTLKQYTKRVKGIKLKVIKKWCRQILTALDYLHSFDPPIIHRDLKCDNIFINGASAELRLGDFGLSAHRTCTHVASVLGTPEFMAPELYEESYSELVDIYSFGMCVLEMTTKEYPYEECTNAAQIWKKVTAGQKPEVLSRVRDPQVRAFIEQCIAPQSVRLSAAELLQHPFLAFRKSDWTSRDNMVVSVDSKSRPHSPPGSKAGSRDGAAAAQHSPQAIAAAQMQARNTGGMGQLSSKLPSAQPGYFQPLTPQPQAPSQPRGLPHSGSAQLLVHPGHPHAAHSEMSPASQVSSPGSASSAAATPASSSHPPGVSSIHVEIESASGPTASVVLHIHLDGGRRKKQIKFSLDFRHDTSMGLAGEMVSSLKLPDPERTTLLIASAMEARIDPVRKAYFASLAEGAATSPTQQTHAHDMLDEGALTAHDLMHAPPAAIGMQQQQAARGSVFTPAAGAGTHKPSSQSHPRSTLTAPGKSSSTLPSPSPLPPHPTVGHGTLSRPGTAGPVVSPGGGLASLPPSRQVSRDAPTPPPERAHTPSAISSGASTPSSVASVGSAIGQQQPAKPPAGLTRPSTAGPVPSASQPWRQSSVPSNPQSSALLASQHHSASARNVSALDELDPLLAELASSAAREPPQPMPPQSPPKSSMQSQAAAAASARVPEPSPSPSSVSSGADVPPLRTLADFASNEEYESYLVEQLKPLPVSVLKERVKTAPGGAELVKACFEKSDFVQMLVRINLQQQINANDAQQSAVSANIPAAAAASSGRPRAGSTVAAGGLPSSRSASPIPHMSSTAASSASHFHSHAQPHHSYTHGVAQRSHLHPPAAAAEPPDFLSPEPPHVARSPRAASSVHPPPDPFHGLDDLMGAPAHATATTARPMPSQAARADQSSTQSAASTPLASFPFSPTASHAAPSESNHAEHDPSTFDFQVSVASPVCADVGLDVGVADAQQPYQPVPEEAPDFLSPAPESQTQPRAKPKQHGGANGNVQSSTVQLASSPPTSLRLEPLATTGIGGELDLLSDATPMGSPSPAVAAVSSTRSRPQGTAHTRNSSLDALSLGPGLGASSDAEDGFMPHKPPRLSQRTSLHATSPLHSPQPDLLSSPTHSPLHDAIPMPPPAAPGSNASSPGRSPLSGAEKQPAPRPTKSKPVPDLDAFFPRADGSTAPPSLPAETRRRPAIRPGGATTGALDLQSLGDMFGPRAGAGTGTGSSPATGSSDRDSSGANSPTRPPIGSPSTKPQRSHTTADVDTFDPLRFFTPTASTPGSGDVDPFAPVKPDSDGVNRGARTKSAADQAEDAILQQFR